MAVVNTQSPEDRLDGGSQILAWLTDLFPWNRSLTGQGLRDTLHYLKALVPGLVIHAIPSGTPAFDWVVPPEWNIDDAYIADRSGRRIVDFKRCNLHVVGYSEPVDREMTFAELQPHLHYLPNQPDAIPYRTSYYKRQWGFCLTHREYREMEKAPHQTYRVRIDATLKPGEMNYADLVVPGRTDEEVFFSTYVCHPSMANNELSGPCVQAALARWVQRELPERRFTYRFYFGPETIGAITYLSRHLPHLKRVMVAGFVLSCLGDERQHSYLASRQGNTLADRVAAHVLHHEVGDYQSYSILDRGSDERQYCAPGVDLPVCTLSRTLFRNYPEYHTSLDNLDFVSADGLQSSLELIKKIVLAIEGNTRPKCLTLCEPQLGRRNLYPALSTPEVRNTVAPMMDLLAYADGERDLLSIADVTGQYIGDLIPLARRLVEAGVIEWDGTRQDHGAS